MTAQQAIQQAIQQLTSPERDAAAVALQFVWAQPAVTAAVVGMRTMAQLQDALKAASSPALSETELQTLRQAAPAGRYQEHR